MEITIRMNADEMQDAVARGLLEGLAKCGKEETQSESIIKITQPENNPMQTPVSYTHLDVYKRQNIHRCGFYLIGRF